MSKSKDLLSIVSLVFLDRAFRSYPTYERDDVRGSFSRGGLTVFRFECHQYMPSDAMQDYLWYIHFPIGNHMKAAGATNTLVSIQSFSVFTRSLKMLARLVP